MSRCFRPVEERWGEAGYIPPEIDTERAAELLDDFVNAHLTECSSRCLAYDDNYVLWVEKGEEFCAALEALTEEELRSQAFLDRMGWDSTDDETVAYFLHSASCVPEFRKMMDSGSVRIYFDY